MKKYLIASVFSLCSTFGYAQSATQYCELDIFKPYFKNYHAKIKYKGEHRYQFIMDKSGNKTKFASEMDALDYMLSGGWQLVTAYSKKGDIYIILKK
jgi:hypothetical protein